MTEAPPPWLEFARELMNQTAFINSIGGKIVDVWPVVRARLPYADHLVGNPQTGVVHGGVITALLDHASGIAAVAKLNNPLSVATLDLRIDYMRPAKPQVDIIAECECMRVAREIAFVRGVAHQGDLADPIALSTGAFMLLRGASSVFEKPA